MIGTIALGAAGLVGGLMGGLGTNRRLKQQVRYLNEKKKQNEDWYNRRYNEDATQRADAQRLLALTEQQIMQRNREAAGRAAVSGGTEESQMAAKQANARAVSDVMSNIAVQAGQRKDAIENQYMKTRDAYDEQIRELKGQKVNGFDMVGNMLSGAAGGVEKGLGLDYKYDRI